MVSRVSRQFSIRGVTVLGWPGYAILGLATIIGLLLVWLPLQTAVILIAGTAVVLLTIIQPLFGLALALLAGPFGALEAVISGGGSALDSGQLLLFFALAAWIGRGLVHRRIFIPHTFLNLPFLILIVVGLLSLIGARSVELGIRELLKWVEMWVIVLMVVDLGSMGKVDDDGLQRESILGGPPRVLWVCGMLLTAGISQALIGIWQFGLRGDGPEHFLVLERFYRAYGTFEQPNPFGGFMNLSALLAIGVLVGLLGVWWRLIRNGRFTDQNLPRLIIVSAFVLFAALVTSLALVLSWSRGAWLGFAFGIGVMVFFWPRKRIYGVLLLGLGLLIFVFGLSSNRLPAAVTDRITGFVDDFRLGDVRGVDINDDNYAVLERQAHWQAGLDMLNDNVFLGVGFGNYAAAYPDYALINWPDPLGHAHNYYINLLAEVGVLGLTAYLLFWTAVIWQSIFLLRRLDWPGRGVVLGLLGVWAALAAHHLVDKLYVNNIYIHLGVLLGLLQLMDLEGSSSGRLSIVGAIGRPVEEKE